MLRFEGLKASTIFLSLSGKLGRIETNVLIVCAQGSQNIVTWCPVVFFHRLPLSTAGNSEDNRERNETSV